MGANMRPTNCDISGYKPFPKIRIWHNASNYVIKGSPHTKEIKNKKIHQM